MVFRYKITKNKYYLIYFNKMRDSAMNKMLVLLFIFLILFNILNTIVVSSGQTTVPKYRKCRCIAKGTFTKAGFATKRIVYAPNGIAAIWVSFVSQGYNPEIELYVFAPKSDIEFFTLESEYYYYHGSNKNGKHIETIKELLIMACDALTSKRMGIPLCSIGERLTQLIGTGKSNPIDVSLSTGDGYIQYIVGVGVNCQHSFKALGGVYLAYEIAIPDDKPESYAYGWYNYMIFFTVNKGACVFHSSQVNTFEYYIKQGTYFGETSPQNVHDGWCKLIFPSSSNSGGGGGGSGIGGCSNRPYICSM